MPDKTMVDFTALIVATHIANHSVPVNDVPALIKSVHDALAGLGKPAPAAVEAKAAPAVSVRSSIKPDALTCLDCGKKFKTLKRHINRDHGLMPADYREKWDLPSDYPMVAPAYAARRSELAKKLGLGRKPAVAPAPKTRKTK